MEKLYFSFLPFFLNFFIGFFGLTKIKNKKIGTHFFIFILFLNFWSIFLFFYFNKIFFDYPVWAKTITILSIFLFLELVFFIFAFSEKPLKELKISLIIFFSLLLVIAVIFFTNKDFWLLSHSPPYFIFFIIFFLYAVWLIILLFERFLNIFENQRSKAIAILVGFGAFLTFIAFFSFFSFFFFVKDFSWLNIVFVSLYAVFIILSINHNFIFQKKLFWLEIFLFVIAIALFLLLVLVPQRELKILTFGIIILFFFASFYFLKMIKEELKEREKLKNIAAEWEKLDLAKDQFILSFQHHLRTPLVPIKGYLEMILKGAYGREENPLIREKLLEIKKLSNTLYSLIEGLLDLQQIKMGKQVLNLEDCQVNDLVESVIEELSLELESRGLFLKFEKGDLPIVKIDKRKIREAIWNLIDNALKYTLEGEIKVITKTENDIIKIIVSDTGIGMAKEEIDRFLTGQLFERGKEAQKLYGPGRGIGLSLSIEFVKAHKGRIFAQSKGIGQGSTFWIELPISS